MTGDASRTNVVNMIAAGVSDSIIPVESRQRFLRFEVVDGLMVRRLALIGDKTRLASTLDDFTAEQLERSLKLRDQ